MAKSTRSDVQESLIAEPVENAQGTAITTYAPDSSQGLSRAILNPVIRNEFEDEDFCDPSDEAESDELIIPYVGLTQKTSKQFEARTANLGDIFTNTGTNLGQWAIVIPLWYSRQAIKFKDGKLECRSLDGITGSEYGPCAKCQFNYAIWQVDDKGKQTPPACTKLPSFPSIVVSSEKFPAGTFPLIPVAFQFAKTSAKAGRKFTTEWDMAKRQAGKSLPYYRNVWKLVAEPKENSKGKYSIFDSIMLGPAEIEVMRRCSAIAREWSSKAKFSEPIQPPFDDATAGGEGSNEDDEPPF